jgi:hypothetical protein
MIIGAGGREESTQTHCATYAFTLTWPLRPCPLHMGLIRMRHEVYLYLSRDIHRYIYICDYHCIFCLSTQRHIRATCPCLCIRLLIVILTATCHHHLTVFRLNKSAVQFPHTENTWLLLNCFFGVNHLEKIARKGCENLLGPCALLHSFLTGFCCL